MKIWLSLPFLPLDVLPDVVLEAERLGVEGVTVSDHVCVPAEITSTYPYTGRRATLPIDTSFPDPIALVASLGARTTRLRFMTHVLVVALRHPVVLAKELATISALAAGRIDVGVGVGWLREEFDAVGVAFDRRGSITDESLAIMCRLWSGEPVSYGGNEFQFGTVASRPTPHGTVPLLGGGYSSPAIRRSARLDGWVGVTPTLDELSDLLDRLAAVRQERGDAERAFVIRSGLKGTLAEQVVADAAAVGVDGLIVSPHQLGVTEGSSLRTAELIVDGLRPIVEHANSLRARCRPSG